MQNTRDNRITVAQFIATISIVVLHSGISNGWGMAGKSDYAPIVLFEGLVSHICQVAVPTFFFFSGYLMYINYKPDQYLRKLRLRIYSLVVPYLIWNVVATVYFALLTNIPIIASKLNQPKKEIGLNLLKEIIMSENTPLWYIRNLFVFTVLAIILYRILNIRCVAFFGIIVVAVLGMMLNMSYYSLLYWLPMYGIGAYTALHHKSIPKCTWGGTILLITIMIVSYFCDEMMYLYRFVAAIVMPILLCSAIKPEVKVKWYMNVTLFIYCTHFLVISTFQKAWKIIFGMSICSAWMCYLVTPVLVLGILFISAYLWKKYLPRSWSVVTGGRSL